MLCPFHRAATIFPGLLLKPQQFSAFSSMASANAATSAASSSQYDKILWPPREVNGMVQMDRSKFRKSIEIPCIHVPNRIVPRLAGHQLIRTFMFPKMPRLKPFRDSESNETEGTEDHHKLLLFDPDKFAEANQQEREELLEQIGQQFGPSPQSPPQFRQFPYEMAYEDWEQRYAIRAVLPEPLEFSGFEKCGHIIHLNLREELLPYRFVLGEILLDKVAGTRTVVNKQDMLTHEFRVMDMELLAGEADYQTEVVEHGIRYKLDYSKVFWNSRLSTVHANTVEKFDKNSMVFDVFAGIGPFVLPAVKKRNVRMAYANDLNPEAIEFMRQSIKANKIPDDRVETFVMDGADFIRQIIPAKIAEHCCPKKTVSNSNCNEQEENAEEDQTTEKEQPNFHVVMNLPGYSADNLPHFRGFLSPYANNNDVRPQMERLDVWIHCHFFVKADADVPLEWFEERAAQIVREKMERPELEIQELNFCRKVAGRKCMYCARIRLPMGYAFASDNTPKAIDNGDGTNCADANGKDGIRKRTDEGTKLSMENEEMPMKKQRI